MVNGAVPCAVMMATSTALVDDPLRGIGDDQGALAVDEFDERRVIEGRALRRDVAEGLSGRGLKVPDDERGVVAALGAGVAAAARVAGLRGSDSADA